MPLFDIPGWSVTAAPIPESTMQVSKKRKRPVSNTDKVQSAEVNLEKLLKRLKGKSGAGDDGVSKGDGKKEGQAGKKKNREKQPGAADQRRKSISLPKHPQAVDKDTISSPRAPKRSKTKHEGTESKPGPSSAPLVKRKSREVSGTGLTALQQGMKQSLDGARFR